MKISNIPTVDELLRAPICLKVAKALRVGADIADVRTSVNAILGRDSETPIQTEDVALAVRRIMETAGRHAEATKHPHEEVHPRGKGHLEHKIDRALTRHHRHQILEAFLTNNGGTAEQN